MSRVVQAFNRNRTVWVVVILGALVVITMWAYRGTGADESMERSLAPAPVTTTPASSEPSATAAPTTAAPPVAPTTVAPTPTAEVSTEPPNHDHEPARPAGEAAAFVTTWVNTYYDTRIPQATWEARLEPGATDYLGERLYLVNRSLLATGKTKGKGKKKRVVVNTVRTAKAGTASSSFVRYRLTMRSGDLVDVECVYDVNGWVVSSFSQVPR